MVKDYTLQERRLEGLQVVPAHRLRGPGREVRQQLHHVREHRVRLTTAGPSARPSLRSDLGSKSIDEHVKAQQRAVGAGAFERRDRQVEDTGKSAFVNGGW